jgi:hypothetical protein
MSIHPDEKIGSSIVTFQKTQQNNQTNYSMKNKISIAKSLPLISKHPAFFT